VLGLIARNPTLVGGTTAFLVALTFVSANALWYQPHAHSGAFFATRDFLRSGAGPLLPDETTILIERPHAPRVVEGDPTVKSVQATLKQLSFYAGEVDGLYGPNTRLAIEAYQSKMGMAVTGSVDDSLLDQLGTGSVTPVPSPAPRNDATPREQVEAPAAGQAAAPLPARDEVIAKVQAGLREFGNEAIEVDGLMGAKTATAIREFQSLFGLAETGEADQAVYAKMKEIGLIR
jgi:peptidoglycan hydrolase-like protein with peptidoglycan-binding domain